VTKHQLKKLTDSELYDIGILRENIDKVVATHRKKNK